MHLNGEVDRQPLLSRSMDPATAERLTDFFAVVDDHVERRVSVEQLLSHAAGLLGRGIGAQVHGIRFVVLPDGAITRLPHPPEAGGYAEEITVCFEPAPDRAVARVVAQRLEHALRLLARHDHTIDVASTRQRALRSALGRRLDAGERAHLLAGLGLAPGSPHRVAAIAGPAAGRSALAKRLRGRHAGLSVEMSGLTAVVLHERPIADLDVPVGCSIGIGDLRPPASLHRSWNGALTALRFSLPSRRAVGPYADEDGVVLSIERIGVFRVLADAVPPGRIVDCPDVAAIGELAAEGGEILRILEAVAATESVRQAATRVNLHRSSIAARIARAERSLGFSLSEPYGRARLLTALTVHRLATATPAAERSGEPAPAR